MAAKTQNGRIVPSHGSRTLQNGTVSVADWEEGVRNGVWSRGLGITLRPLDGGAGIRPPPFPPFRPPPCPPFPRASSSALSQLSDAVMVPHECSRRIFLPGMEPAFLTQLRTSAVDDYRRNYRRFRSGKAHGAQGEGPNADAGREGSSEGGRAGRRAGRREGLGGRSKRDTGF